MSYKKIKQHFTIFFVFVAINTYIHTTKSQAEGYSEGPGPLFSFGLAIQEKGKVLISEVCHFLKDNPFSQTHTLSDVLYGVTDKITVGFSVPLVFLHTKDTNNKKQHGLGDVLTRAEFVLYQDKAKDYTHRTTLTLGLRLPTTTIKELQTIFTKGGTNYFIGLSRGHEVPGWFYYSDLGYNINMTGNNNFKHGNELIFDMGLGKKLIENDKIFLGLKLEMSGIFYGAHTINSIKDRSTGRFFLLLGPAIRFSVGSLILQWGMQWPIAQHVKREENNERLEYRIAGSLSYIF